MNMKNSHKCSAVIEERIFFESSILHTVMKLGVPQRIRREGSITVISYHKSILDFQVTAEYLFINNKLIAINYSHETLGFESINSFLNKCEECINQNADEGIICCEHKNNKHWSVTDGDASKHICLSHNGNSARLTIAL